MSFTYTHTDKNNKNEKLGEIEILLLSKLAVIIALLLFKHYLHFISNRTVTLTKGATFLSPTHSLTQSHSLAQVKYDLLDAQKGELQQELGMFGSGRPSHDHHGDGDGENEGVAIKQAVDDARKDVAEVCIK